MIYAVFLCDTKWKIIRICQSEKEFSLHEGEFLTEHILEKEKLNPMHNHYAVELTFLETEWRIPAIIDSFKEGNLVILAEAKDNAGLIELNNQYSRYVEWAKNHLIGLFHDEYFQIQQMNNQLVDAQRRLTRSNRQLEVALKENKEINEQLEQARIYAERANRSKTRFLANMSHDIRTPMNAIIGLAELMEHHMEEPEILKNYLLKLQSSSHYLLDLINDILDLSKIENGSMELKTEPMDIGVQIEKILTIIRPRVDEKSQNLLVQSGGTEFGCLSGDSVRFRQILMNLFSNAVKYTPDHGEITFTVHELERNEHERSYQFVVADNGIGMKPEFAQHIFEPFSRDEEVAGNIQGTGLGMAITKSIVDAMGGTICVESTPGKGSRFSVELSFAVCTEHVVPEASVEEQTEKKEELADLRGMRFLCAEDNELNAEILTAVLELEGAQCTIYENGKLLADAFEKIKPGEYDAILLDVQMPVMNGYETARTIRNSANLFGKDIPIIAMTANAFAEDIQKCIDAGMDAHIAKPIDIMALKKTVYGNKRRNR